MKMTKFKRILSVILSFVLIAVIALTMYGCGKENTTSPDTTVANNKENTTTAAVSDTAPYSTFTFKVTHKDGSVATYTITSNKATVGEALVEANHIAGENGDYGLYVKTVDGETLDYATDGLYWAFYENGEYAATGVDQTKIKSGSTYEFRAEK